MDELRKDLVALERQKDMLVTLTRQLEEQLNAETTLALASPELGQYFGGYRARVRLRQEGIAKEIVTLDQKMDTLRGQIAEVFGEQKRYEIVQASAELRARKIAARKEGLLLDEIGSQQFMRVKDNA